MSFGGNRDSDDDDEGFLQDLLGKQKLKQGNQVALAAASSSRDKGKNAATGGGSFQSMGAVRSCSLETCQRG